MQIKSDFLVIGSGIAGLFYALKAAELALCHHHKERKGGIQYELRARGIASVIAPGDTFESHIADTMNAGADLCIGTRRSSRDGRTAANSGIDGDRCEFTRRDGSGSW